MDTISKDKGRIWDSLQFKFGLSYILIIAGVLLLLNTYPLRVSQDLVFRSKATTLQKMCIRDRVWNLYTVGAKIISRLSAIREAEKASMILVSFLNIKCTLCPGICRGTICFYLRGLGALTQVLWHTWAASITTSLIVGWG